MLFNGDGEPNSPKLLFLLQAVIAPSGTTANDLAISTINNLDWGTRYL